MNIYKSIRNLLKYALEKGLILEEDLIFYRNKLLELFLLEDYQEQDINNSDTLDLEQILAEMLSYAIENGFIEDTQTNRDLFDTKIMGLLTPPPSYVIKKFWRLYEQSPQSATDFYYNFSQANDYIRTYRIQKDKKWKFNTQYGDLDITINLSKPEKDPKDIALQKNVQSVNYPKCPLCKENVGYAGRLNHPARQNHRVIPLEINNEKWGLQYSPYVYYNEHSIMFSFEHKPMAINRHTFKKLLDFVKIFPHYFIGSNADLPIVGGSILSHDHYQAGRYTFALAKADYEQTFSLPNYPNVTIGIVKWPMSVIRLEGENSDELVQISSMILDKWKSYSDGTVGIFSHTNSTPHNTITPIVRMNDNKFQVDLVLRNNITNEQHPLGVFHPHSELHNIKKENIGLIEVMGLAVLPARLKDEIELLKEYILHHKDLNENEILKKHCNWVNSFKDNYNFNNQNIDLILQDEIGKVFLKVLEHAGVFKRNSSGKQAFVKFINTVLN